VNGAGLAREADSRITTAVESEILTEFDIVVSEKMIAESDAGTGCSLHQKIFPVISMDHWETSQRDIRADQQFYRTIIF
jgi:hypothetical protein